MKFILIFLAFTITLLTSCNTFDTIIENENENEMTHSGFGYVKRIYFTNTSQSKFLEVTIKEQKGEQSLGTHIVRVKPGVRDSIDVEFHLNTEFLIVAEREIFN